MKRILLFCLVVVTLIIPLSAFAKVPVLAGRWRNASVEELLFARKQIDDQIIALGGQLPEKTSIEIQEANSSIKKISNVQKTASGYEIRYGFMDHNMFSEYLTNGIYKCGYDFDPGEYYIFSLYGTEANYGASDNAEDFPTNRQVMRKIYAEYGQYIKLGDSILVNAEEVDTNNWYQYGIFLVGKDFPAGDYRLKTITPNYKSELCSIMGIRGGYQICYDTPEAEPFSASYLRNEQTYITLEDGQYIAINNAVMTLCSEIRGIWKDNIASGTENMQNIETSGLTTMPTATQTPPLTPTPMVVPTSTPSLSTALDAVFLHDTTTLSLEYKNALKSAKSYIEYSGFSKKGLIEQLEYEGYSELASSYAADHCGADWNKEAVESAAAYLNYSSFSRNGLIEQLEYEGFTNSQAVYGVTQNGY